MKRAIAPPTSPWKGLAPYEDTDLDALLFFGRDREQEVIASNVIASRLTVLYGPSGVGKSSVLRAGVAYRLRAAAERAIEERGHPDLAVVVFDDWRGEPVADLRVAVEGELGRVFGPYAVPEVEPGATLAVTFAAWTRGLDCDLLLILDQLDEYFVYHPDEGEEEPFVDQLSEVVTARDVRVNVLLSLREDALAKLDRFKARIPNVFSNYLRLDRLTPPAAREAVLGPLERYNEMVENDRTVDIEPALVDAVVEQTGAGRVALAESSDSEVSTNGAGDEGVETAYLQLVLGRIWEEEQTAGSRILRAETLRGLGGAAEVVRGHVRRALEDLDPRGRDLAATMFNYLVTPSGTKIAHSLADLGKYAKAPPGEVDAVVDVLSRERVLRPVAAPGEANGAGRGYEIFHDVLADPVLAWRRRHEETQALERERREASRRHRRLVAVTASALMAVAVMAVVAAYAWSQRSEARDQARAALARELTASAFARLPTNPSLSLLLALEATKRDATADVEDVLRAALVESRARAVIRPASRTVAVGPTGAASVDVSRSDRLVVAHAGDNSARIYDVRGRFHRSLAHGAPVTAAVFGPYPDSMLTASEDGMARVWNARTGDLRRVLLPHGAAITAVAFGARGRVATGDRSGRVVVWYPDTGGHARALSGVGPVHRLAFSRNASLLLVVSGQEVRVFDAATGSLAYVLHHRRAVTAAAFSATGRRVVTASADGATRVWDARTGARKSSLRGDHHAVTAVAFSRSGRLIATGTTEGTVRIFDASNGRQVASPSPHKRAVTTVAFSSDGRWILSASRDRTARVSEAETGRSVAILAGHRGPVGSATFTADGRTVVTAGADGSVRTWELEAQLAIVGMHPRVTTASLSPDGGRAVSGGRDGAARIWDVPKRRLLATLRMGGDVVAAMFTPDGSRVVTAGSRGARVWRVKDGSPLKTLTRSGPIVAVAVSADGALIAAAGPRGVARVWNSETGALVRTLRHGARVEALAFAPDGATLATVGRDGVARIWATKDGPPLHVFGRHAGAAVDVAFDPHGDLVVTAGRDAKARVWAIRRGTVRVLMGHRDWLTDVAFSPNGRLVASASTDHDARIWDARSGKLLHVLSGHHGTVRAVGFSSDGRWLVTAGPGAAGLWNVRTGSLLSFLRGHTAPLVAASFAPHGNRILTAAGGNDGTVRMYVCGLCADVQDLVRLAERRVRRSGAALTAAQRLRYLHESG